MAWRLRLAPEKTNINFFRLQWITLGLSAAAVAVSLIAFVTLGFSEVVRITASNEIWLTNGTDGISGIPGPWRGQGYPEGGSGVRRREGPPTGRKCSPRAGRTGAGTATERRHRWGCGSRRSFRGRSSGPCHPPTKKTPSFRRTQRASLKSGAFSVINLFGITQYR